MPARPMSATATGAGRPPRLTPTSTVATPPTTSAPSPPMTRRPARAGIAVHSAVSISGAAWVSVVSIEIRVAKAPR